MKALIVLSLIAMSSFANATAVCTASDAAKKGLYLDFPKVQLTKVEGQIGTVFVGVDGVCKSGDKLVTTSAHEVCYEMNEASECVKSDKLNLSAPLAYTKSIPTGGEAGGFEDVDFTTPLNYEIPAVLDMETYTAECVVNFTIPDCSL